jgi:hypothetical protein
LTSLEARDVPSWTAAPGVLSFSTYKNVNFDSNARSGTGTIANNEVDVYAFQAPRTGTYTFDAGKNKSLVDTVAGLYRWSDNRRVVWDDDSGPGTDSQFTAELQGGTWYTLAVTNYSGTSTGGYKWSITGPPLSSGTFDVYSSGSKTTHGSASLAGNALTVDLWGYNGSYSSIYTHRVDVYLVNANGYAIHTGSWSLTDQTGGDFVLHYPSTTSYSRTFDVSGFDLRDLQSIVVIAS